MPSPTVWRVIGFAAVVTLLAGLAPAQPAAAGPRCSAFTAKVYDQVNPKTNGQALSGRGDHAVAAQSAGATKVQPTTMTAAPGSGTNLVAVHRLFKKASGTYFYAYTSAAIKGAQKNGYTDQGVVFYASTKSAGCLQPVYSYFKKGQYRFVASAAEQKKLQAAGWKKEIVRFYLGKASSVISFAVYPDTQMEVHSDADTRFIARSQWVVDTMPLLATRYVMHTGDIVNWDTADHDQYVRAQRGMAPLASKLSHSAAAGNHDTAAVGVGGSAIDPPNTATLVRNTTSYNTYLRPGMKRTTEYEPGRAENSYSLFSAGGLNWMVLTLELWPRKDVVAWARKAVAAHPKHNVVVVTHSYLSANGTLSTSNGGYGATSPKYLYDNLIKVYPNIKMTFSGHTGTAAYRRDVGVKGNVIHNYLLAMHSNTTNPTRIVEVNVSRGAVSSWVYAPLTKTSYPSYYRAPAAVSWIR